MTKEINSLEDLTPDQANPNKGTARGRYMIEASLRESGAGRSILADKNGRVIAGNKTLETWADLGGEIEVVKTDGKKLVVVQREDLDLDDPTGQARKLSYYDNRASEVSLDWDAGELFNHLNNGLDLSTVFFEDERDKLLGSLAEPSEKIDASQEWTGMPAFENEDTFGAIKTLKVHFASEADMAAFAALVGQTVTMESTYIWYPKQQKVNLKAYVAHES
jgi:hypothetical protein